MTMTNCDFGCRYVPSVSANGTRSLMLPDSVAFALEGHTISQHLDVYEKFTGISPSEFLAKNPTSNPGQIRMKIGQRLRRDMKKVDRKFGEGHGEKVLFRSVQDTMRGAISCATKHKKRLGIKLFNPVHNNWSEIEKTL